MCHNCVTKLHCNFTAKYISSCAQLILHIAASRHKLLFVDQPVIRGTTRSTLTDPYYPFDDNDRNTSIFNKRLYILRNTFVTCVTWGEIEKYVKQLLTKSQTLKPLFLQFHQVLEKNINSFIQSILFN